MRNNGKCNCEGNFISGVMLGGLIGAGAALLFAPQSGEETRKQIKEKGEEAKKKAEKAKDDAVQKMEDTRDQAKDKADEIKKRAEKASRAFKEETKKK